MSCDSPQCRLEKSHLLRRLQQCQPDAVTEIKNADAINLFDKITRYKRERDEARKELGEVKAQLAMIRQMVEDDLRVSA